MVHMPPPALPVATALRPVPPPAPLPPLHSPDELMEAGKRLRDMVPRVSHSDWKKPADRADPIEQLQASDAERLPELPPVRYGRMLASPFTFCQGAAGIMAADLVAQNRAHGQQDLPHPR